MPPRKKLIAGTIAQMDEQLLAAGVRIEDLRPTAELLEAITAEMDAMRAMDVGVDEPATTYDASGS